MEQNKKIKYHKVPVLNFPKVAPEINPYIRIYKGKPELTPKAKEEIAKRLEADKEKP